MVPEQWVVRAAELLCVKATLLTKDCRKKLALKSRSVNCIISWEACLQNFSWHHYTPSCIQEADWGWGSPRYTPGCTRTRTGAGVAPDTPWGAHGRGLGMG